MRQLPTLPCATTIVRNRSKSRHFDPDDPLLRHALIFAARAALETIDRARHSSCSHCG